MNEPIPHHSSEKVTHQENEPSPETMEAFNNTLAVFLDELPTSNIEEIGDGLSVRSYDASLPDGNYSVRVSACVVHHENFGIIQRLLVHISRGIAESGPGMSSEFHFSIEDVAIYRDEQLELDSNGKIVAGSDERYSFTDTHAIDARRAELLDDDSFHGTGFSRGVVTPNLQVTPAGDIYQDGSEQSHQDQLTSEISLGVTIRFKTEDVQRTHERNMAAWEQARRDVGTGLTEERAGVLIDTLTRLYPQLDKKKA